WQRRILCCRNPQQGRAVRPHRCSRYRHGLDDTANTLTSGESRLLPATSPEERALCFFTSGTHTNYRDLVVDNGTVVRRGWPCSPPSNPRPLSRGGIARKH